MDLKSLGKNWDEFGKKDPLLFILFDENRRSEAWGKSEFFNTGEHEIKDVVDYLKALKTVLTRKRALDFGCGIGRTTQALTKYFDYVYGVDIAPSMIKQAKKYAGKNKKCIYYLNKESHLKLFQENYFDFIYSNITLQHMESQYAKSYIAEFMRILNKGGVLVFQIPSDKIFSIKDFLTGIVPKFLLDRFRRYRYGTSAVMEMHGIQKKIVVKMLRKNGGKILGIRKNSTAGKGWTSYMYSVRKI